jgi:hypothetical protein
MDIFKTWRIKSNRRSKVTVVNFILFCLTLRLSRSSRTTYSTVQYSTEFSILVTLVCVCRAISMAIIYYYPQMFLNFLADLMVLPFAAVAAAAAVVVVVGAFSAYCARSLF